MHSLVPMLVVQLVELGLFRTDQPPFVTDDKRFAVFLNRVPQLISICKNDGDVSKIGDGMLGHNGGFSPICHLRGGSVTWTGDPEGRDSRFVENILIDVILHVHEDLVNDGKGNLLSGNKARKYLREQAEIRSGQKGKTDPLIRKLRPGFLGALHDKPSILGDIASRFTGEDYIRGLEQRLRLIFNDDKKYAEFLQRYIKLQEMSPEEFMADARRSAEELAQLYPHRMELLDPSKDKLVMSNSMKSTLDRYMPHPDEPSPFGPDQKNYVDNPWVVWKNQQEGYDAQHGGSSVLLREALIDQLQNERYRSQVDRVDVPFEMRTKDGKLSLGYVIHMRYSRAMTWEEAHEFGMHKITPLR